MREIMRDINKMQQELKELNAELKTLCIEDGNLYIKGCLGRNSKRINEIAVRKRNLLFNINHQKQILT